jgi:hypothetical protein
VHDRKITLCEIAEKESLTYAIDRLIPYAHWITPRDQRKRFTALFFLTRIPDGQCACHDDIELVHSCWVTPSQALQQHNAGKIVLMPPTLRTVEELDGFRNAEALFAGAASRTILPVLPEPFQEARGPGFKLPHDPEYTIEDYRQPARPGESSRVVLIDGVLHSVAFEHARG